MYSRRVVLSFRLPELSHLTKGSINSGINYQHRQPQKLEQKPITQGKNRKIQQELKFYLIA